MLSYEEVFGNAANANIDSLFDCNPVGCVFPFHLFTMHAFKKLEFEITRNNTSEFALATREYCNSLRCIIPAAQNAIYRRFVSHFTDVQQYANESQFNFCERIVQDMINNGATTLADLLDMMKIHAGTDLPPPYQPRKHPNDAFATLWGFLRYTGPHVLLALNCLSGDILGAGPEEDKLKAAKKKKKEDKTVIEQLNKATAEALEQIVDDAPIKDITNWSKTNMLEGEDISTIVDLEKNGPSCTWNDTIRKFKGPLAIELAGVPEENRKNSDVYIRVAQSITRKLEAVIQQRYSNADKLRSTGVGVDVFTAMAGLGGHIHLVPFLYCVKCVMGLVESFMRWQIKKSSADQAGIWDMVCFFVESIPSQRISHELDILPRSFHPATESIFNVIVYLTVFKFANDARAKESFLDVPLDLFLYIPNQIETISKHSGSQILSLSRYIGQQYHGILIRYLNNSNVIMLIYLAFMVIIMILAMRTDRIAIGPISSVASIVPMWIMYVSGLKKDVFNLYWYIIHGSLLVAINLLYNRIPDKSKKVGLIVALLFVFQVCSGYTNTVHFDSHFSGYMEIYGPLPLQDALLVPANNIPAVCLLSKGAQHYYDLITGMLPSSHKHIETLIKVFIQATIAQSMFASNDIDTNRFDVGTDKTFKSGYERLLENALGKKDALSAVVRKKTYDMFIDIFKNATTQQPIDSLSKVTIFLVFDPHVQFTSCPHVNRVLTTSLSTGRYSHQAAIVEYVKQKQIEQNPSIDNYKNARNTLTTLVDVITSHLLEMIGTNTTEPEYMDEPDRQHLLQALHNMLLHITPLIRKNIPISYNMAIDASIFVNGHTGNVEQQIDEWTIRRWSYRAIDDPTTDVINIKLEESDSTNWMKDFYGGALFTWMLQNYACQLFGFVGVSAYGVPMFINFLIKRSAWGALWASKKAAKAIM